jgi:hypothetical protein
VPNGNVSDCDTISQDEMDIVVSESSLLDFQVQKREYSIDVSDFTYYYSSLDSIGFQNVTPTSYNQRNDDASALGLITSHNLIEGHKVLMTWKNGVKKDIGTYSFKDDFNYYVLDSKNNDVTNNYPIVEIEFQLNVYYDEGGLCNSSYFCKSSLVGAGISPRLDSKPLS